MAFGNTFVRWSGTYPDPRKLTWLFIWLVAAVLLAAPLGATVNPGEIVPGSVSASVSPIVDPVNGVSVTFRWTTLHRSNSIVAIENSGDYNSGNNAPSRRGFNPLLSTSHVVVVDHFPAYSAYPTWAYYVASQQPSGVVGAGSRIGSASPSIGSSSTWATYPGPVTGTCDWHHIPGCGGSYLTFQMPTVPRNPSGPLVFTLWPVGGVNVYRGDATQSPSCTPTAKNSRECNDLYVALQANLLSGPSDRIVQMQEAKIVNLDSGRQVTNNSINAQYLCSLAAPSNPPPANWDGDYTAGNICYNGTLATINTALRLRVNSQATPGHYQFTAKFQGRSGGANSGNPVAVAYNFTVLPTASFTPTSPKSYPDVPGLAAWQNNMTNPNPYPGSGGTPYRSADWWCGNNSDTNPWWSLDNGNFTGNYDMLSSIYFEAWNYDGGRVYQQIADYDYNVSGMSGFRDLARRDHWKRCAELVLEPYKDMTIATHASYAQEPNQFAYGMAMNYLRTGDATMQQGVNFLATNPVYKNFYAGCVYPSSARVSAYMLDDRLAAEIAGAPRDTVFRPRSVDVLLGMLDQTYNLSLDNPNQQQFRVHPFTIGLLMESLITDYELDLAQGATPDARIPLEIKKTLDWFSSTQYIAATHTLAYQAYDVPKDFTLVGGAMNGATTLNNLVSPAYAWYWSKTGNNTYLVEGDDLFSHVFDDASFYNTGGLLDGGWTWSVKEFNQIYKWSFDYVRWRTGRNPDGSSPAVATVLAAANPCDSGVQPCKAPWTDWTTPVQMTWVPAQSAQNPNPSISLNVSPAPTVTSTSATFSFNTFKPASTTVYYGTTNPGNCNLNNPAPPLCMQPFPNFGFRAMLAANYSRWSLTVPAIKNNSTANQYDPLGAPNVYNTTVTITGLTPNTTYHWRPLVVDASGNSAAYHDQTFTTRAR